MYNGMNENRQNWLMKEAKISNYFKKMSQTWRVTYSYA